MASEIHIIHLENENSSSTLEVDTIPEIVARELANIKLIYERELNDSRKLLAETAREREIFRQQCEELKRR